MKYILVIFLFFSATINATINTKEIVAPQEKNIIIVYGSDTCHYCVDTKTYLKKNNIAFTFYDIDLNMAKRNEMVAKARKAGIDLSSISLPVIDKNGIMFYNSGDFDTFLKRIKK